MGTSSPDREQGDRGSPGPRSLLPLGPPVSFRAWLPVPRAVLSRRQEWPSGCSLLVPLTPFRQREGVPRGSAPHRLLSQAPDRVSPRMTALAVLCPVTPRSDSPPPPPPTALSDPVAKESCMLNLLLSLPEANLLTFLFLLDHLKRYPPLCLGGALSAPRGLPSDSLAPGLTHPLWALEPRPPSSLSPPPPLHPALT